MRRRPYRQAIPLSEIREREQDRVRSRQRRRQAVLFGGTVSGFAASAMVIVTMLSAFGQANARSGPASPLAGAEGPGIASTTAGRTALLPDATAPAAEGPAITPQASDPASPAPTSGGSAPPPVAPPPPVPASTSAEPEQLVGYKWPLRSGRVSSFFASRTDGFLVVDGMRIHEGLDLATFCGDKIRAAHDGVVLAAGRQFGSVMGFDAPLTDFYARLGPSLLQLPIVVVIDDGNGYRSVYAHLSVESVKVGQVVRAGDVIGVEGASGHASGCHLHYELIRMDGAWMKVAPELVKRDRYPAFERERIDPFRVLSMKQPGHPRFMSGINPPPISPGLGRPTVAWKH